MEEPIRLVSELPLETDALLRGYEVDRPAIRQALKTFRLHRHREGQRQLQDSLTH